MMFTRAQVRKRPNGNTSSQRPRASRGGSGTGGASSASSGYDSYDVNIV